MPSNALVPTSAPTCAQVYGINSYSLRVGTWSRVFVVLSQVPRSTPMLDCFYGDGSPTFVLNAEHTGSHRHQDKDEEDTKAQNMTANPRGLGLLPFATCTKGIFRIR